MKKKYETGVHVTHENLSINLKSGFLKSVYCLLRAAYSYLIVYAFIHMTADCLGYHGSLFWADMPLAVLTAAFCLFYEWMPHKRAALLAEGVLSAAGILLSLRLIVPGARAAVNAYIRLMNAYPNFNIYWDTFEGKEAAAAEWTAFILAAGIVCLYMMAAGFWHFGRLWPVVFICAAAAVIFLMAGIVPAYPYIVMILAGLLGLSGTGGMRQFLHTRQQAAIGTKMMLLSGLTAAALILLVTAVIRPEEIVPERTYQNIRSKIQEKYRELGNYLNDIDLFEAFGSGADAMGISEGRLDKAANLSYSGKEEMRVTVDKLPESMIYLKGYGGGRYDGKRWLASDDKGFDRFAGSTGIHSDFAENILWTFPSILIEMYGTEKSWLEVKTAGNEDYLFVPYTAECSHEYVETDGYIKGRSAADTGYRWVYFKEFYNLMDEADELEHADFYLSENIGDFGRAYSQYADSVYMQLPEIDLNRLKAQFTSNDAGTAAKIRDIQRMLKDTAAYSLEPGAVPKGKDILSYFLFENKKGYCMHFATAGAVILRMNGIPSRYAEGYVISPGDFTQNHDGTYSAVVRDYQAHAWAEAYIPDFGWLPVEMTPPYVEDQRSDVNSPEQSSGETEETVQTKAEQESETAAQTETKQPAAQTDAPGTSGETSSDRQDGIELPAGMMLSIAAFAAVLLALIVRIYAARAYFRRKLSRYSRRNVQWLALKLQRWFKAAGFKSRSALTEASYIHAVAGALPYIQEALLADFMEIVLKASYSKNGIALEEYIQCIKAFDRMAESVYEALPPIRRFIVNILLCLPRQIGT